jgi:hypothetical protein
MFAPKMTVAIYSIAVPVYGSGRGPTRSIGASAGDLACGQPFGVGKRKTAGKREEGRGAAMLSPRLEGEQIVSPTLRGAPF